ncbi:MAG: tetratricopeptide repeat protein [Alphaproteobacteria bacterium]
MSAELFNQAVSLHRQGKLEEAARVCQQLLLHSSPAESEARYLLAFLRYQQGRIVEALQAVEAALARNPAVAKFLLLHGILLQAAGKPVQALTQLTAAAAREPKNAEIWYSRGVLLGGLAHHEEALASFDKALAIWPTAECWNNRGAALQSLKRVAEDLQSFDAALALKPDAAQVWVNRARVLQDLARFDEAIAACDRALSLEPGSAVAWNERANAQLRLKRYEDAVASYDKVLQIAPQHGPAIVPRAVALQVLGKLDDAEAGFRQAIALQVRDVTAHIGLGNVLNDRGDLEGAVGCYRRAMALDPNIAEAHNNCGNALNDLGRLDEAIICYRRALALMPGLVQAANNIAVVVWNQGDLNGAEKIFRQIIQGDPGYVTALDNLASLLSMRGDAAAATTVICQSLGLQQTQNAQRTFVDVIRSGRWTQDNDTVRSLTVRALSGPWGRPADLAQAGAQLLKLDAHIGNCIARAVTAWPNVPAARELYGPDGAAALLTNPLLCALLTSSQNPDIDMERFLTVARHLLLDAAMASAGGDDPALPFYSALAQQCFINEYVFPQSAGETGRVEELCARLTAALESGAPVSALWITAIAAYRPLGAVPLAARLLDRQWPDAVGALLAQQIAEPQAEAQLRAQIPRLTDIADGVSRDVQQLYEENPYPRWVRSAPGEALKGIGAHLYRKFPLARFQRHAATSASILVAGCGTGQHPIEVAQRFDKAQVLAIDLSLSSLAYARRKAQELGLTNIAFGQADILELGSLGRSFDLIESAGVLHHMTDPFAGWDTLLSLLRPGGFMMVGLYSQIARRDILRARQFIAARKYASTPDQIRQCRQEIIASAAAEGLSSLLNLSDFFSISTCRDLLFHVQERYVTLAEIDAFLRARGLTLLGFEINRNVLHAYRQRFPDDPAAVDLGQWQIFEQENPGTFASMYQFWIQKPV